jgi:predicted aspartyl protease
LDSNGIRLGQVYKTAFVKSRAFATQVYSSNISGDGRHYVDACINTGQGACKNVKALADTGNDITILTKSTARRLGFNPEELAKKDRFFVKGINGAPEEFAKVKTNLKLGDISLQVPIGLATKDDALSEDLLGRAGIIDSGKVYAVYGKSSVKFVSKSNRVAMCGGSRYC